MKYHLVQKGNPSKPEEPNKYYANAVTSGEVTLRELSKEIAEISTVSTIDTIAAIESLLQLIPRHLRNAEIVRLGDFGSFAVHIQCEGAESEETFSTNLIKGLKLFFRPGNELKKSLENLKYEKE
jgi:predicted histone-like DNA-binding protein